MASLFGQKNDQKPDWGGLGAMTSSSVLGLPIMWGLAKLAPNMMWAGDYEYTDSSGGKGGVFQQKPDTPDYKVSLQMAICEGPVDGIPAMWRDQGYMSLEDVELVLWPGTYPQEPWSYLVEDYPLQALSYPGVAYVAAYEYDLGQSATVANHNFEVERNTAGSGFNNLDADPAWVIADFLCNPSYGVGFPASSIDGASLFTFGAITMPIAEQQGTAGGSTSLGSVAGSVTTSQSLGACYLPAVGLSLGSVEGSDVSTNVVGSLNASVSSYCKAVGLAFSPVLTDVEDASTILQRWLQILNIAGVWSGNVFRFIPFGDTEYVAGTIEVLTEAKQIQNAPATTYATQPYPTITVCFAQQFVEDGGVTYLVSGTPLVAVTPGTYPAEGEYTVTAGLYVFNPSDALAEVQITYSYEVAANYQPNNTPVYALTDDDFQKDSSGGKDDSTDPIIIVRSDPYKAYNVERLEVSQRDNAYNLTTVEARDQDAIERFGLRVDTSVTAHEICDVTIGAIAAQLILQRVLYIRNTAQFKLTWEYCALDPMDVVTLTTPDGRLNASLYRIISIEEGDDGRLDVVAEEMPPGVAAAPVYATSGVYNQAINTSAIASTINAPFIGEPSLAFIEAQGGSQAQVWIGACASVAGEADPNWGGCTVYISIDNVNYDAIGNITMPARMGTLTGPMGAGSGPNPDTTSTCAVNVNESGAVFGPSDDAAASQGATACMVDNEIFSYSDEALTSPGNYAFTRLWRHQYGTARSGHSTGAVFCRLDGALLKYTLPANFIGMTLYLKFSSFNIYGGGSQNLADLTPFTYSPKGSAFTDPIFAQLQTGFPVNLGSVTIPASADDSCGSVTAAVTGTISLGSVNS